MSRALHATFTVALSLWIGGLVALTVVAAPVIFRVSGSRQTAGAIFGSLLRTFGWIELALAVVAATALLAQLMLTASVSTSDWIRVGGLALMIVFLLMSSFGISPAMHELRPNCGSFDAVPATSEESEARARFNELHRWSERVVGATMLLGLIVLTLTAIRRS